MAADPDPGASRPHWPRDAPVRWGAFARGLVFQVLAVVGVGAQLALGVAAAWAIAGGAVDGASAWVVAIAWGALALAQFRAWWFRPNAALLVGAPVLSGVVLAALAGWLP